MRWLWQLAVVAWGAKQGFLPQAWGQWGLELLQKLPAGWAWRGRDRLAQAEREARAGLQGELAAPPEGPWGPVLPMMMQVPLTLLERQ